MKKSLPVILTIVIIFSFIFGVKQASAETYTGGCSIFNAFGCVGQALTTSVLGFAERAAKQKLGEFGDMGEAALRQILVLGSGAGSGTCFGDAYCSASEKCDTSLRVPLCVPRNSALREEYLAALKVNPYLNGGALGAAGRTMGLVYTNPLNIRVGSFFQDALANNILNPTPAYGQTGFAMLERSRLTEMWVIFRNISYLMMAVVLAIAGIMVMTRAKTDPRTVVTFQSALPRVAVSLVLIYLSWPIAGFLMDIGNIVTQLVKAIYTSPGIGNAFIVGTGNTGVPIDIDLGSIWSNFAFAWRNLGFGGAQIGELLFQVGMLIAALLIAFGITWTLISRYGTLYILAVISPIMFLFSAIPGKDELIGRWFKLFLINVLVFPGMYFVINLAQYIRRLGAETVMIGSNAAFSLPFVGGGGEISGLLAMGLLAASLKIPTMLEEVFDVKPGRPGGFQYTSFMKGIPVIGGVFG